MTSSVKDFRPFAKDIPSKLHALPKIAGSSSKKIQTSQNITLGR